jgi:hypothetical protein
MWLDKLWGQPVIDVGGVPGHRVRIFQLRRIFSAGSPVFAGLKVVESWTRGYSDSIYLNGRVWGDGASLLGNGRRSSPSTTARVRPRSILTTSGVPRPPPCRGSPTGKRETDGSGHLHGRQHLPPTGSIAITHPSGGASRAESHLTLRLFRQILGRGRRLAWLRRWS